MNHQKRSVRLCFRFPVFCTGLVCIVRRLGVFKLWLGDWLIGSWAGIHGPSLPCGSLDWSEVTKAVWFGPTVFVCIVIVSFFFPLIFNFQIIQHLEIRWFLCKSPDLQILSKIWSSLSWACTPTWQQLLEWVEVSRSCTATPLQSSWG